MRSQDTRQIRRNASAAYVRHRPETTLLYHIVREYWPEFQAELASHGKHLPAFICREFDEYLKCGRLEHGFLRVRCESCHHEKLVAFSCKRRGFCPSCGARRMADSAALLVDDVLPHQPIRQWVLSVPFPLRFLFASQPKVMGQVLGIVYRTIATQLTHKAGYTKTTAHTWAVTLIQRFGGSLNLNVHFHMLFLDGVYLGGEHGPARFRWVKAPTSDELAQLTHTIAQRVGRCLERLCRYIARPAVSTKRLSMTRNGQVRYELKTPWRNGTTHILFEPLNFISRLVALVPRPRVNLTRYHGLFAPHSKYRALVTPARRGKRQKGMAAQQLPDPTPAERRASMTWARRLKRVFNIDIETCSECGGAVKVIASIEDPAVINKILAHLDAIAHPAGAGRLPPCRAPPSVGLIEVF